MYGDDFVGCIRTYVRTKKGRMGEEGARVRYPAR